MNISSLGLCSVTFRKLPAEKIVDIAVRNGISYIEWGADVHVKNLNDAKAVKELCDKNSIKISSYGSYFNSAIYSEDEWTRVCEIAKTMDAESIRIWLGKKNSEDTDEEYYSLLLSNTKKMCDIAKSFGLLVCPECHDNTFNNNTDAILKFINDLQRENFRTYFQSRYYRMAYDIDRIERTHPYIKDVHISFRDLKKEQLFRKKDRFYIKTLLRKLYEMNFQGIVMIEFVCSDKEKALIKDIEKLKKY